MMMTNTMTVCRVGDGNVEISAKCPMCGKISKVTCKEKDWFKYQTSDSHIQDIFPYLSASDREIIQTGICDECWNTMFDDNN